MIEHSPAHMAEKASARRAIAHLHPAGYGAGGRGPRGQVGPLRAGHPLVGPLHDLAGEATLATRGDHQPAARVGGVRLVMTGRTERHQAVEIEVRAALDCSLLTHR